MFLVKANWAPAQSVGTQSECYASSNTYFTRVSFGRALALARDEVRGRDSDGPF